MRSTGFTLLVAIGSFLSTPLFAAPHDALSRFVELRSARKYAEAESVLHDAWIQAERSSPKSAIAAGICQYLGKFYFETGRHSDAERLYKHAIALWAKIQPSEPERQADAVNSLAILYLNDNRLPLVEQLYAKYFSGWLASLKSDNVEMARAWNNLGFLHYRRGRFMEAEAFYLKALALPDDRMTALNNLGVVYLETARLDRALECFNHVLAIEEKRAEKNVLLSVNAHLNVAAIYCLAKRWAEALKFYDRALQDALNLLGPEDPLCASAAERYAEALRILNRKDEAKDMTKLVRMLRESSIEFTARHTVDLMELKRSPR